MKKRILSVLLAGLLAVSALTACTTGTEKETTDQTLPAQSDTNSNESNESTEFTEVETEAQQETIMDYTKYTLETYTKPYWEGNVVYNETLLFIGKDDKVPLLYTPTEIISVRNFGLDIEYQEGVDYVLEDGKLCLCENTSIPYFTLEEFYPDGNGAVGTNCMPLNDTGKQASGGHTTVIFGEGTTMVSREIVVTYRHADTWTDFVPADKSGKFDRFLAKLEAGEEVTVLYFGDSITVGCNASGWLNGGAGVAPYMDTWMTMFVKVLEAKYPNATINVENTAVGGMDSKWGVDTVQDNAIAKDPDLMILAFGMNDYALNAIQHTANISKIVEAVQAACSDCDICVISTTLPNPNVANFCAQQGTFEAKLLGLETKYEHVAVAQMSSVHAALMKHKRYSDMTGNNVNHPSDFLIRTYTQTLARTILGE